MDEQQRADRAARDGELFRLLVENVVDYAIFVVDAEGLIRSWSYGAERLLGYTGDEVLGRSGDVIYTPEDRRDGVPERERREALDTGRGEDDRWHVRKDGSRFWASGVMTPLRDERGGLHGFAKITQDRTDWWHAEQARLEAEARLRTAFAHAAVGMAVTDTSGRFLEANPAYCEITGYSPDELRRKDLASISHPDDLPKKLGLLRRMLDGAIPGFVIEKRYVRKDGGVVWVKNSVSLVRGPGGEPLRIIALTEDISQRIEAAAAVAERQRLSEFHGDIGLALARSGSLPEMLDRCAEVTVRRLDGAFARIWTVNDAGDVLEMRASAGMYTHTDGPHARIPVGQYKIGLIARDRRPLLTNSVIGDPRVPAQDWAEHEGIVAFAGYPLIVGERLIGVWAMFSRHALSDATLEAMGAVANGIATGIERGLATEALAESEAWLSTTLSSIGDAVIATDDRGHVRFMNPVAEAMTGWTQGEASGRPIGEVFRIVNEQTRRPADHPVARVLREGVVVGLANHTILIARDGTEAAIEDSAAPIKDREGRVVGVVMVFQNATERRRHQAALQESERRHRTILESITDAFFAVDGGWRFTYVNGRAETLLGRRRDALLGKSLWAEFPGLVGTEFERAYRGAVEDQVAVTATSYFPDHGRWYEVHNYPTPDGLSVYFRDVSERVRDEERLRRSERQLADFFDNATVGLHWVGPDGTVLRANRAELDLLGYDEGEYVGRHIARFHADKDVIADILRRLQAGEPLQDYPARLRCKDGSIKDVLIDSSVMREGGEFIHTRCFTRDVTERRRAEEELRAAKDEAEAANRAKTQFLAVLSHELRTPLNPILLAASSMLDRPCDPEEMRPTLEMIRQNVNLQARLIDDLLDVMRIVQGKMPLHWGVSDCHALILRAVEICQSEVHGRGHRLDLDLSAAEYCVNADSARLQQVLWNLVKNAVKFTPEGGTITVRTRNEGAPDERIVIEVADTGIGIEPDVLPTIWDPFQQGETTITRRFGGLGLGLAICKGVVDAHGGSLEVESPGKGLGTTFRVALRTMPAADGGDCGARDVKAPPPPPTPSLNRLRILLVEDEVATLRLMSRLLVGLGHEVTATGTVDDALAAFEGAEFDLIISDIGLPDGTGLDLMRKVKSVRRVVPAIALTGYGMDEDIRRSREAGFTTHMTKPIDFTKLEAMIRQVAG